MDHRPIINHKGRVKVNQKRAGCVRFVHLRPCVSGSLWMYEQAPNPQKSESTWRLAEAKHRLLTKNTGFHPLQKIAHFIRFQKHNYYRLV